MKMNDIKKIAQEKLLLSGYDITSGHSYAIAKKDVDSTGGDSNILVWLTKGDEYHEAVLSAEYTTKGNNVLSTSGVLFKKGVSAEKVASELDDFITRVKIIMDKSVTKKVQNKDEDILTELDVKYSESYVALKDHQVDFANSIVKNVLVDVPKGFSADIAVTPNTKYDQTVKFSLKADDNDSEFTGIKFNIEKGAIANIDCVPSLDAKLTETYIDIIKSVLSNPELLLNKLNTYNGLAITYIDAKRELDKANNPIKNVKQSTASKKFNK